MFPSSTAPLGFCYPSIYSCTSGFLFSILFGLEEDAFGSSVTGHSWALVLPHCPLCWPQWREKPSSHQQLVFCLLACRHSRLSFLRESWFHHNQPQLWCEGEIHRLPGHRKEYGGCWGDWGLLFKIPGAQPCSTQRQAGCRSHPAPCCQLSAPCPSISLVPLEIGELLGVPQEVWDWRAGGPPLWRTPATAVTHSHAKKAPSANLSCFTAIPREGYQANSQTTLFGLFLVIAWGVMGDQSGPSPPSPATFLLAPDLQGCSHVWQSGVGFLLGQACWEASAVPQRTM